MQGALTDPTFKPLLAPFEPLLLESQGVCAYGLWSDLRLAYFSPGWFEFSAANGGEPDLSARWTLGTDLLSAIQGPLRPMFRAGYVRALAECRPWEHLYECSSAEQFRTFQMMAYPLADSAGLLVVHSLLVERPHPADPSPAPLDPRRYEDADGLFHQCSYCRRMRRATEPEVWDRVTEWVKRPPRRTSHGICEGCMGYYAPRFDMRLEFQQQFTTTALEAECLQ